MLPRVRGHEALLQASGPPAAQRPRGRPHTPGGVPTPLPGGAAEGPLSPGQPHRRGAALLGGPPQVPRQPDRRPCLLIPLLPTSALSS